MYDTVHSSAGPDVARHQRSQAGSSPIFVGRWLVVAGLLVGGLIHFALTPHHLQDSTILGVGFFGVAVLECAAALLFGLRSAPTLWLGTAGLTVFSLTMYAMAVTTGLPFGHEYEAIAAVDLICKGAELVALAGLLASIHSTTRDWPRGPSPRMAPYSRYAYLVALVMTGVVAALMVIHFGHRLTGNDDHAHAVSSVSRLPATTTDLLQGIGASGASAVRHVDIRRPAQRLVNDTITLG